MRYGRAVCVVLVAICMVCAPVFAGKKVQVKQGLDLTDHIPRDPLFAAVFTMDNLGETFDSSMEMVSDILGEGEDAKIDEILASIDEKLGVSLRNDILPLIGPECAITIDIPPIDEAVGAVMVPSPEGIAMVLGKFGLIKQVREGEKLGASLKTMLETLEVQIASEEDLMRMSFPMGEGTAEEGPQMLHVYYGIKDGIFALGFSPTWVRSLLQPRPEAEALRAGADFQLVSAQLDADIDTLIYVNLPRLHELVTGSEMIQGAISSQEEAKTAFDVVFNPENMNIGLGMTSVEVGGGVRYSFFGPTWMSGGAGAAGAIAAVALPNLLKAIDSGGDEQTMSDMRTVGIAIEAYYIDNVEYPGPTDGWVEVDYLKEYLEVLYVNNLPLTDGWGNTLMFWSDGQIYKIVSPGEDGVQDRSWDGDLSGDLEYTDDIVYTDGVFVAYPEGAN